MFFPFRFKPHGLNKRKFLCKGRNGELGNVMRGMMVKRGITVGMMGMREIRVRIVGIRKIRVGMQDIRVEMRWNKGDIDRSYADNLRIGVELIKNMEGDKHIRNLCIYKKLVLTLWYEKQLKKLI